MAYSLTIHRLLARASAVVVLGALAAACSSGSSSEEVPPADSGTDGSEGDTSAPVDTGADAATDTGADVATDTGPVACKTNADCASDPKGKFCLVSTDGGLNTCVPCLPGTSDECATGTYCSATSYTCETGCKSAADCSTSAGDAGTDDAGDGGETGTPATLTCDTVKHRCVGCAEDTDCPLGSICDTTTSACVAGCNAKHPCAPGKECCGGSCFDTQKDVKNCGGCGTACPTPANGTAGCTAGVCGVDKCDTGWSNCDGLASNGCEVNTGASVDNCGTCGNKCALDNATATCTGGTCAVSACATGFDDCDKAASNGCEVNLKTLDNCGACGSKCTIENGVGSCASGTCALTGCLTGFGDCDGVASNGCETNTQSGAAGLGGTIVNCGSCGITCSVANGTPSCVAGACGVLSCTGTFKNCDGNYANGCEVNSANDKNNCGACANACNATNGTPSCVSSKCEIACATGFGDCDLSASTGCETNITTNKDNCNGCGNVCATSSTVASTKCVPTSSSTGACAVNTCTAGRFDNNGILADGCECASDTIADTCFAAEDLGAIAIDGSKVVTGNLSGATSDVDWYKVTFTVDSLCTFSPNITLAGGGVAKMAVYTSCTGTAAPGVPSGGQTCNLAGEPANSSVTTATAGFDNWEFTYSAACGDKQAIDPTPEVTPTFIKAPTTVWVKVFRIASATTCYPYTLTIGN